MPTEMQGHNNGLVPHWREENVSQACNWSRRCRSLGIAALAPSAASAHGFHHHWGPGWGWGYGGLYVNTGASGCYQERVVPTRHSPRLRVVNVCAYGIY